MLKKALTAIEQVRKSKDKFTLLDPIHLSEDLSGEFDYISEQLLRLVFICDLSALFCVGLCNVTGTSVCQHLSNE